jgi:hypothetical protein
MASRSYILKWQIFKNSFIPLLKDRFGFFVRKFTFAKNCRDSELLFRLNQLKQANMFWTLELASYLEDAPWPATKDELIDYAIRSGAPIEVVENLQELEDEGEIYEGIEDIWPDYPSQDDFFFNEDEY